MQTLLFIQILDDSIHEKKTMRMRQGAALLTTLNNQAWSHFHS